MLVLVGLAAAGALVAAVTAIRRPETRRLAVRSATRRPAETALVTLGALLGTAIITGSLIVGDTLRSSLEAGAFTQLGPVDETVTAPGIGSLPDLRQALTGLEDAREVDGVAFGLRSSGTAAARVEGNDPAVQPDVLLLEVAFDAARGLGQEPGTTGFADAATPASGQVAISADLAEELAVAVGDQVTVFAYGASHRYEVDSVLPRVGLAGYSTGLSPRSFNIFLAPGTLGGLIAAAPQQQQASPPIAMAFISNQGGVRAGVEHSDRVAGLVGERIATVPQAEVTPDKQQLLDTADDIGSQLSEIFLGIGAFAVIAGILLLVNVFVMLANERRGELGILRAVGMQRIDMVRAFFLEGSLYATAAALLGALAGIGVGAAIVQLAQGISGGPAGFTLDMRFSAEPTSILTGLLVGFVISLVTILVTSVRISRLNIIRAIRELPEPPRRDRRTLRLITGWAAVLLGGGITAAAVDAGAGAGLFVGPAVAAGGLVAVFARALGRRPVITAAGLAVVAWGVSAPSLMPDAFRNADVVVFVVQGLVITGAGVMVLARNQATVGRLLRGVVGGTANVTARLGVAYPLARPFRTTMTLAMYALIVFTLVLVSLLAQVVGGQTDAFADAESGGYDLLVTSAATSPLPPDTVREFSGVQAVAPLRHAAFNVEFRVPGREEFQRWFASGYDRAFLRTRPPALDQWLPRLTDERAAWELVLNDPSTMIVGSEFLQEGGAQPVDLGDVVDVRDPVTGNTARRTVVATMQGGLAFSGAFMSSEGLTSVLGPDVPTNRLYVAVGEQTDPAEVAAALEQQHIVHGVEARTFHAIVADRQQQNRRFMRILQGYLMLGLLVGIAGLGVVMVRAVRERRQQIGVLRSIGLQPETVGGAFMLEAAFIALQGIVVGSVLGTATAYQLIANAGAFGGRDVTFQIPWGEITLLLAITLAASVAAAGWPARRASRIRPAVALRTGE